MQDEIKMIYDVVINDTHITQEQCILALQKREKILKDEFPNSEITYTVPTYFVTNTIVHEKTGDLIYYTSGISTFTIKNS